MISMKPPKNSQMSDYKKDIIDLIGVDYEAVPVEDLKEILKRCVDYLPTLLDKNTQLTYHKVKETLEIKLGIIEEEKKIAENIKEHEDQYKSCEHFKENFLRRRSGKIACNLRGTLGSYMSKRILVPVISPEDKEDLLRSLKNYFPFKSYDAEKLELVFEAMSRLSLDAGDFLIKEGDFIEKFYYVQAGLFGKIITSYDKCYVSDCLKPGECFGSECILFGHISHKTIKCLQAATVWVIESVTFHSVCHWGLAETNAFLDQCIFKTPGLEGNEGMRLVNALQQIKLESYTDVIAQTPRSALYIVLQGEVLVKEENFRGDIFTRTCGPGGVFGQDRLFTTRFNTLYSAVTLSSVTLFYLNEDAFHRLFDVPELYKKSDIEPYQDDLFYRKL